MKQKNHSKIVRTAAIFTAAAAAAVFIHIGRVERPVSVLPQLDLVPSIRFGLDLTAPYAADEPSAAGEPSAIPNETPEEYMLLSTRSLVEVWNGEKAELMPLEEYIIGVTAAEMPAEYESEALKAQAVAARTFTLKHMTGEAHCRSGHTICTDPSCCQAFLSADELRSYWGDSFNKYYEKIRSAVLATEGMVLTSGGELVTALYHSSSGGRTENCEAVFAVALPYLVSVESEGEEDSPEFSTVKSYSKAEFAALINENFPDAEITDPEKDVNVWQRTESGRITLIRLGGVVVTGQQLRNALHLHSTNARFDFDADTVRITCLGFGHGVGMSQCGANAMAKRGCGFEEILLHYYTGVELTELDPP